MNMTIEEQIAAKEAEIKNYKRILENYRANSSGRWYHNGQDRLAELNKELSDLIGSV